MELFLQLQLCKTLIKYIKDRADWSYLKIITWSFLFQGFWILSVYLNHSKDTWRIVDGLCLGFLAWRGGLQFAVIPDFGPSILRGCRSTREDCWAGLLCFRGQRWKHSEISLSPLIPQLWLSLLFLLRTKNFESEIYQLYAVTSPNHLSPMDTISVIPFKVLLKPLFSWDVALCYGSQNRFPQLYQVVSLVSQHSLVS